MSTLIKAKAEREAAWLLGSVASCRLAAFVAYVASLSLCGLSLADLVADRCRRR